MAVEEDGRAQQPVAEERVSTPTSQGQPLLKKGPQENSSRGVGASSLQKYLISVQETLTPDEDDELPESNQHSDLSPKDIGMHELREEAQSARNLLSLVLDKVQTRDKRRHADISRIATSVLVSVRELGNSSPLQRKDCATQTEFCDELTVRTEQRIEDDDTMVELMLLTARVASRAAQETAAATPSVYGEQSACRLHADQLPQVE